MEGGKGYSKTEAEKKEEQERRQETSELAHCISL